MKKGFTLVELLCVLGIIAILSTISVPVLKRADENSRDKADNAMILVYTQAIESYRLNDYGALARIPNKRVTIEENGRVKFNSELNMSSDDVDALSNSGILYQLMHMSNTVIGSALNEKSQIVKNISEVSYEGLNIDQNFKEDECDYDCSNCSREFCPDDDSEEEEDEEDEDDDSGGSGATMFFGFHR